MTRSLEADNVIAMRIWMIRKGALILAALLLGACALPRSGSSSKTEAVVSKSNDQALVCTGSVNSYTYPGPPKTQPARAIVVLNHNPALTKAVINYEEYFRLDRKAVDVLTDHREVCQPAQSPGAHCNALKDGDTLKVTYGTPAMIVTTLELDTKSLELKYGIGYLDGGWSFSGTCSAI